MIKSLIPGELIIAIDFDGTITTDPNVGGELVLQPECKRVLNRLWEDEVRLVLWTCRTGDSLEECLSFLREEELFFLFSAINDHAPQVYNKYPEPSRKVGADLYLDDRNFGAKIDWIEIEKYVYGED